MKGGPGGGDTLGHTPIGPSPPRFPAPSSRAYNSIMAASGVDYSIKALASVHETEKIIEISLKKGGTCRLEVVRRAKGGADVRYDVRVYGQRTRYIAPNGAITAESVPLSMPYYIWVPDQRSLL